MQTRAKSAPLEEPGAKPSRAKPAKAKPRPPGARLVNGHSREPVGKERPSSATTQKILTAAVQILFDRGARGMSMTDVCARAGVSRGTLYRYFLSKEELLNEMALHLRAQADQALEARAACSKTPDERLKAVFKHIDEFTNREQSTQLMRIEPDFAIGYYRRNLPYLTARTAKQLALVFDDWEKRLDVKVDRAFLAEMLIRYGISQVIVPCAYRDEMPARVATLLKLLQGR